MADFVLKRGDLLPELNAVLRDRNGPVDLTAADGVDFHMRVPGTTAPAKVDAPAEIVDEETGSVKYVWEDGDTDTAGEFYGEFQVTWGDDRIETFPNDGQLLILVTADLA